MYKILELNKNFFFVEDILLRLLNSYNIKLVQQNSFWFQSTYLLHGAQSLRN
jgi:hypothetical protein